ncbi:hypothetical protein [Acinetobacter pittii]|uniref:hypothetical protein n=1 Tax=Acinetobacter pittii TaxID=48296 RepID=UPI0005858AFD|nr:hypothetical protein [Acinetobacter pittii]KIE87476.1 hypothetical protein SD67_02580 [Acinetobacter pittii]
MQKNLIASLLFAISHSTVANNNFDADSELIKLGIIGQDFKYIDLDLATEFFKIGNRGAENVFPYKANDYVEIISGSTSPFYSSITLKVLVKPPLEDESEVFEFIKSDEGIQIWCDGVFKTKYMRANNHQYELFYINKLGEKVKLILLNNGNCK